MLICIITRAFPLKIHFNIFYLCHILPLLFNKVKQIHTPKYMSWFDSNFFFILYYYIFKI